MKFSTLVKLAFAAFIAGANAVSDEEAREQCVEASEKYSGCYFKSYTFTDDNLFDEMNQMCIDYYEEECQSFYNKMEENGNILEGCEAYHENNLVANEKYDIFFYTNFVKHDPRYMHALMNLICEFNQYNDFCPIARNIASGRGHLGDDVIYENCKDYRCHVTYVKLLNWELKFAKISDEVRHAVEVVNGDKCQDLFFDNNPDQERPTESSEKETTTSSKKSEPTSSTNGRCGPDYGACSGSNECCSKYGWCGTTDDHCGSGCQSEFGVCGQKEATSTTDTTTSKTTTTKIYTTKATTSTKKSAPTSSSTKDRCGPDFGACSGSNECCSQYGWCGTSEVHCGSGCQSEFGICGQNAAPSKSATKTTTTKTTTKTTSKVPTSTVDSRCGPDFGACANSKECCSKHNYCGTSGDYCGTGCQPKYGICW